MLKYLLGAGCCATLVLGATQADAATNYSFSGAKDVVSSDVNTFADGVTITATAQTARPPVDRFFDALLTTSKRGYGVKSKKSDNAKTDGKGKKDTIWLEFSSGVALDQARFTKVGGAGEKVRVLDESGQSLGTFNLTANRVRGNRAALDLAGLSLEGTKFGFQAIGKKSSWLLASLTGDELVPEPLPALFGLVRETGEEKPRVSSVPTPAAAGLGLIGLGVLLGRRRRPN